MTESEQLQTIFGECCQGELKGFTVGYCELCEAVYLRCPKCKNISCNGSGCDYCVITHEYKTNIASYLNPEEIRVFNKIHHLRRLMEESLKMGDKEIDFKKMRDLGQISQMSQMDEDFFAEELK